MHPERPVASECLVARRVYACACVDNERLGYPRHVLIHMDIVVAHDE